MKQFLRIREIAKMGILSEYRLRALQHEGRLPGIFAGGTYLVDVELLQEVLRAESLKNAPNLDLEI